MRYCISGETGHNLPLTCACGVSSVDRSLDYGVVAGILEPFTDDDLSLRAGCALVLAWAGMGMRICWRE